MAEWERVRVQVEALQQEKEGLKLRLDLKAKALVESQREVSRLRAALEMVHGDVTVIQVERPALVVVG